MNRGRGRTSAEMHGNSLLRWQTAAWKRDTQKVNERRQLVPQRGRDGTGWDGTGRDGTVGGRHHQSGGVLKGPFLIYPRRLKRCTLALPGCSGGPPPHGGAVRSSCWPFFPLNGCLCSSGSRRLRWQQSGGSSVHRTGTRSRETGGGSHMCESWFLCVCVCV